MKAVKKMGGVLPPAPKIPPKSNKYSKGGLKK